MKKVPKVKWTSCDEGYPTEKGWNIVLCGDPAIYLIAYWDPDRRGWQTGYGEETARHFHLIRDRFWRPIPAPPEGYVEMASIMVTRRGLELKI